MKLKFEPSFAEAAAIERVGLAAVKATVSDDRPAGLAILNVLVSGTVVLIEPTSTPLAFVVPLGCVSVLPVPVEANAAADPEMGFEY